MQSEQLRDLTINNRYVYDLSGRKKEVYQKTNNDPEVELAEYHYNELGQLIKKNLHGDSISHLQGINYRYNIRGWLTSINNSKLDNDGLLNDEDNSAFGEELSYDNGLVSGGITGPAQWNGNISGMKWKTRGPDISYSSIPVNAYAFQYDKLNRMTLANYGLGFNGSSWNDWAGNFNEEVSYDAVGNIKTLLRKGGPDDLDNLVYNYLPNSNKLLSVADNSGNILGFNDGNQSGNDYEYDCNGNLTKDLNKKLGFSYNFLNLPQKVSSTLYSGVELDYLYDATGQKLKKSFPGEVGHYYIDGIEYNDGSLLFAMTEEGRVRPKGDGTYTYDYFLKDHLGNVRVMLATDNSGRSMVYPAASMETMAANTESTYYSNLDKVRNVTPVGFKSLKKNEKVAHLKGTDPNKQIGPSITVKVNSGDKISLTAQSFYPDNSGTERTGLAETALSQLVNAMVSPVGFVGKGKAIAVERLKAQGLEKSAGYRDMMNKLPNSDYGNENGRPKAYMVWMLFDKQMKLVKTGKSSGARQIPEGAGQVKQMAESDIVMDQGGFLTAYTVNESPASVYIDNFQLSVVSGNVLDENNYYPFGMINDGLSNVGFTDPINNYKYNGKELQNELSLGWLDYGARFYDPVIGRWNSVDPKTEKFPFASLYTYCFNNPIRLIDPDGQEPTPSEAARMAAHVYGDKKDNILTGGWRVSSRDFGIKTQDATGLKSQVYERVADGKVTEYTYATAGTEANWKDVGADVKQPLGLSKQYHSGAENAKLISGDLAQTNTELTFVGHSLGGGEAALNSILTGRKAITFNAAGVSDITKAIEGDWKTPLKSESNIDAYIMLTDPLNALQNGSLLMPDVNGNKHYLTPTDGSSIYNGHSMDNVLKKYGIKKPEEYNKK